MIPPLLATAIVLSALVSWTFLGMLAVYYVITTGYSFYLKRKVLIDVFTLAVVYTIRILAGGVAANVVVSEWLLAFSVFIFLALAIVKRHTELVHQLNAVKANVSGRGYQLNDLSVLAALAAASGYSAVLVLALYINRPDVSMLYEHPRLLWLVCPLLLYWFGRVLVLSNRGEMHDDPVVFAVKDPVSLLTGALIVAVIVAAM